MIKSFDTRSALLSILKAMEEDKPKLKIFFKGEFLQEGFEAVDKLTPTCVVMNDAGEAVYLGRMLGKMDEYLVQYHDLFSVALETTGMMLLFEEKAAARRINKKYSDNFDEYNIKDSISFAVCDDCGNLTSPGLLDLDDDKHRSILQHRR